MTRMTTAEATVECLIGNGIDTIYGLPGLHNDALFDAFHRAKDRLRVLHTRHEQTAGYMALGAALATGKPQAFAVVPGPGVLNASAALLTAYGMNAPVVALVGQIPHKDIDRAYGHLHELPDQLGLLRHITKAAARVRAAHDAPAIVCDLIRQSISGRQRPVAVECAIDIWGRAGSVELPSEPVAPEHTPVDEDAVEGAAKNLGKAMRAALPEDGIFIDEVTQVGFASRIAFPVEQPRTFLSPGYQDNLGWGYGAALGVKSALPDRAVLAIAGDGGFLYQIGELATAAQHRLAVVVVVFDDGAYGNVKRIQQERFGNRLIACELQNPDFTKLAESFGVAAFRAKTAADLERVLKEAFALDAPALVHVPCGEM